MGDLESDRPDLEHVADTGLVLRHALDREVFPEGAGAYVFPSPLGAPERIVRSGVHQQGLIRPAMGTGVCHRVSLQPQGAGPYGTGDGFLPYGAGEGALHAVGRVRRTDCARGTDLDAEEAHGKREGERDR